MKSRAFLNIGGIIVLTIGFFIPVTQHRVISYGIDAYANHTPIFANHTATQKFTTTSDIIGVGSILVNMRRADSLPPVTITIRDTRSDTILITKIVSSSEIRDDQFTFIAFADTPISAHTPIEISYTAPTATIKNPIGLRFGENKESGSLSLVERVPVWKAIGTTMQNDKVQWKYAFLAIGFALIIALPSFFSEKKSWVWIVSLTLICIAILAIMLHIIPQFGGVSGGDPYDYLGIAKSIQHGQNPFLHTKRLPGYPLLLVPWFASGLFDDQLVMRIAMSSAGIVSIILTALIALRLSASWPVAIAGATILAFQKDFIWTAMRPEPYSVYTALLLLSLYLFLQSYRHKKIIYYIFFGLALGYSAMTRQEGFVLAIVLGVCSVVYEIKHMKNRGLPAVLAGGLRMSAKRLALMYLPALLIISPFLISNTITFHNPLYTKYLEGERLQPVDSIPALQDALSATWGIIGSMWKPAWTQLERIDMTAMPFIVGIVGLWAWYALTRFALYPRTKQILPLLLILSSLLIVWASIYAKNDFTGIFMRVSAGFIVASIPIFLIETKWRGLVILLVLVSQLGIATWFHPFSKHYEQSYPLIVLIVATGLLARIPKKGVLAYSALICALLPFLLITMMLGRQLNTAIDKQNEDTALDSVTYRAVRFVRTLPQPVGFDQAYLPARTYLEPGAIYFPAEDNPTLEMENEWLKGNPIKTLVVTNAMRIFQTPRDNWTVVKTFKAAGNDDKIFQSTVYSIQ